MTRIPRAGVHDRDEYGRTPLHYAVLDDPIGSASDWKEKDPARRETLRIRRAEYRLANTNKLITAGADVDAKDVGDWTPLHFAARTDSPEVVQLLLDSGADVNAINGRGETSITIAAGSTAASEAGVLDLLRARGADPFLKGEDGVSAIEFAKMIDDPKVNAVFADLL